jgi:hypothetical protein
MGTRSFKDRESELLYVKTGFWRVESHFAISRHFLSWLRRQM